MNYVNINHVTIYKADCIKIMPSKDLPIICLLVKKHKNLDSENEAKQNNYAFPVEVLQKNI